MKHRARLPKDPCPGIPTYMGLRRVCSLPNGHAGPCRTWIEATTGWRWVWRGPDELGNTRWPK